MSDTEAQVDASEAAGDAPAEGGEAVGQTIAPAPEEIGVASSLILDSLAVIGQRRMPTLDYVNDRFVRAARDFLFGLIRRPLDFKALPAQVRTYGEVMKSAQGRPHITLAKMHPLNGSTCWVVHGSLVYLVVDTMFGGDSRVPTKTIERDLSATELRILRRMMDGLMDEYEKAWQSVREVKFEFLREESNIARADICGPDDLVLHSAFALNFNGREGTVDFCVPFWLLDSIKADLYQPTQKLKKDIDTHWTDRLQTQVQAAQVELVAVLAREEMKIADVLALNVGDIVPLEVLEPITAYVDGLPMVLGQYGVRNGRYAIKVQHVKHPAELLDKSK